MHLADALQASAKVLAYIQLRSLDEVEPKITLPQFRVLIVLSENEQARSGQVADRIGVDASTITRNSDQLEEMGFVKRGRDPSHRNAVTLGLTKAGRSFVEKVREWRRGEFMRIMDRLPVPDRETVIRGIYLLAGATIVDETSTETPPHLTMF